MSVTDKNKKRCGFVSIIGSPNAGKSTLINALVGTKVSIVSPKVQTTRCLVRGVALYNQSQIIFVDTPGIFKPQKTLEKAIVAAAWEGLSDTDLVLLIVDAAKNSLDENTQALLQKLSKEKQQKNYVLVLNKIDKIDKDSLLSLSQKRHVILVGPEGAGKRTLAYSLAQLLAEGKVPGELRSLVQMNETALLENPLAAMPPQLQRCAGPAAAYCWCQGLNASSPTGYGPNSPRK